MDVLSVVVWRKRMRRRKSRERREHASGECRNRWVVGANGAGKSTAFV